MGRRAGGPGRARVEALGGVCGDCRAVDDSNEAPLPRAMASGSPARRGHVPCERGRGIDCGRFRLYAARIGAASRASVASAGL